MPTMDPHTNDEPQPAQAVVEEERGLPQVGRKRRANGALIAFLTAAAILIALVFGVRALLSNFNHKPAKVASQTASALPTLAKNIFATNDTPPPPPPGVAPVASPASPAAVAATGPVKLTPEQQQAADELARRQRAPLLAVSGQSGLSSGGGPGLGGGDRTAADNSYGSLGQALQVTRSAGVAASMLQDPNLTITQGTFIDCVLETALDSEEPGMTRCVLPRNVYSTDGRVLLLGRGSRLVGQYESGQIQQGQRRIFVTWTRVETPDGLVINLDSPSTDALGRSGVSGRVDNHFLQRFGAALLVSIVSDVASYETAKQQSGTGGSTQLNFGGTISSSNNLAAMIAQNTLNIRPTLYKNQGGHIGIFVARDLYFGNVYALRPTSSRGY